MTDLSVIIPTYNRATLLKAVLPRLRAATNAEIILVDDGSTDGTADLFPALDPTVIFHRQANTGPAIARNAGAKLAHGRYLAFLDSDDSWENGRAEACVAILDRHPEIDVLFCETPVGNEIDGYKPLSVSVGMDRDSSTFESELEKDVLLLRQERFFQRMLEKNQVFLGSAIFRRSAWERLGPFDCELFYCADYEICLRYASAARFAFCRQPLATYEKHAGGLSTDRDKMAREFALSMERFPLNAPKLKRSLRKQIRAIYRDLQFGYAFLAYDREDYAEAHRRFGRLLRVGGFSLRSGLYWLLTSLPTSFIRLIRGAKKAIRPSEVSPSVPNFRIDSQAVLSK